jgi:hypothetical protein
MSGPARAALDTGAAAPLGAPFSRRLGRLTGYYDFFVGPPYPSVGDSRDVEFSCKFRWHIRCTDGRGDQPAACHRRLARPG